MEERAGEGNFFAKLCLCAQHRMEKEAIPALSMRIARKRESAEGDLTWILSRVGRKSKKLRLVFRSLSEVEFQRSLHNAGWRGADGVAKGAAAYVAVYGTRAVELGVVEDVEAFEAEEERLGFGEG
jgi:hypothetical protein